MAELSYLEDKWNSFSRCDAVLMLRLDINWQILVNVKNYYVRNHIL